MALSIDRLQVDLLSPEQRAVMDLDTQLIADDTYLVAERQGVLVGCGGWSRHTILYGGDHSSALRDPVLLDPARDTAKIRAMYTHPDCARQGVGRRVLRICEQATENGLTAVELMATLSSDCLYAVSGHVPVERIEADVNGTRVPL